MFAARLPRRIPTVTTCGSWATSARKSWPTLCLCKGSGLMRTASSGRPIHSSGAIRWKCEAVQAGCRVLNDFNTFGTAWLRELRDVCPSVRLAVGWCGIPVASMEPLRGYDIVLTSSPVLLEQFREPGCGLNYCEHAFDPRVLDRIGHHGERDIPVSFVGNVIRSPGFHDYRAEVVERVLRDFPVALYCPWPEGGALKAAARRTTFELARLLRGAGLSSKILEKLPLLGRAISWGDETAVPMAGPLSAAGAAAPCSGWKCSKCWPDPNRRSTSILPPPGVCTATSGFLRRPAWARA